MHVYSAWRKVAARIRKLTADLCSAYSSSDVRYAGLMLTRIAPIAAVAYWTTTHSYRLGDHIPTRSPFLTPRAMRPRATTSHASTSSRYVERRSWRAATSASLSPNRDAVRLRF